jgi:hypothetical protein
MDELKIAIQRWIIELYKLRKETTKQRTVFLLKVCLNLLTK